MWHTIFTIFKRKVKKDRTKKIICKKNGKKEKQVTGVYSHTQERIEKIFFFFGFCDFMLFFDFWVNFCSTLLENNRFCFVPFL